MAKRKWENKPWLLKRWEYAREQRRLYFDTNARQNYAYYDGTGHWSQDEQKILASQDRPITILNYVFKQINLVAGNEIQNRNDLYVFPIENGDVATANILNYIFKYVKKENNADWKFSQANIDGLIASQGWMKNYIEYPDMKPEIKLANRNPLMVYFDPDSIELSLDDAQEVFESIFIPKQRLVAELPHLKEKIEKFWSADLDTHDLYVDEKRDLARTLWIEYKKNVSKPFWIVRQEGVDNATFEVFDKEPDKVASGYSVRQFNKSKPVVYGVRMLGDIVLEGEYENPFQCGTDKFSYTMFAPYFVKGVGISLVDQFKSIQDLINKSYSQALDILNRQPKVGGIFQKGSIKDPEELEEISRSGKWISVEDITKVQTINPPMYPQAHMETVNRSIELIKEISGTPEVFVGEAPGRVESGLGIQILRKQAGLPFEQPADNMRVSMTEVGRKILNQIAAWWSNDKVMRLMGNDGNLNEILIRGTTVNQKTINARTGDVIQEKSFNNLIADGKYDFVIDINQPSVTQRMYQQMIAVQLFTLLPRPELAPLLIDMLDFPNKDEWKNALMQSAQAMQEAAAGGGEGGTMPAEGNPLEMLMGGGGGGAAPV